MAPRFLLCLLVMLVSNLCVFKKAVALESSSEICTFSEISVGVLAAQGTHEATKLVTFSEAGGSPTQVDVNCSKPVNLSISAPIQVLGTQFTPIEAWATATASSGNSTKNGDAPIALPAGTSSLLINYSIDKGSRLRAGKYRYIVKFTVVQ